MHINMIKRAGKKIFVEIIYLINKLSPFTATKILHYKKTGKWPNLNNPKDFNEKLQWLKLNEDHTLKSICADKYEVYNYIKNNYDDSILNRLIAVYDNADKIDWNDLPHKFVLKCNHGCEYNIVVENKDKLNKEEVVAKLNKWLNERFGKNLLELHYDYIKPKIIVEEFIENKEGLLPLDYKIYCFNGKAKLVLVCSDRESELKLDFLDLEWNRLSYGFKKDESIKPIKRPSCFEEMVRHAEELSKPFSFVRVDFYDKDGKVVFGEMTFTPAANMANYYNENGLEELGKLLELNNLNDK